MASEVNRRSVSAEAFSSFSLFLWEPVDRCLLVCIAFFMAGLQPKGCTKQLASPAIGAAGGRSGPRRPSAPGRASPIASTVRRRLLARRPVTLVALAWRSDSVGQFPTCFSGEFADLLDHDPLCPGVEEAGPPGVQAARLVAALGEHPGRRQVTEDILAVPGEPEPVRPQRLLQPGEA